MGPSGNTRACDHQPAPFSQLLLLRDLRAELSRGTLALFDCLGALPAQFPSDLWVMQHVRATALTGPSAPASSHTGPARPTGVPDTAGRGNRPRIGPVRQHPPGLRLTVLRGHHRFSVDCTFDNGAIDTLVFDLLVQHHNQASLPPTFLLVLSGAQPLRMGYYQEVVFVVQDGSQTATVWDGRHLGQELQVNLHPTTQSTCQVLDADWINNGWRLFVNGVPEAAAMRHVRVGDYLQPCSGSQCPGVVPLGSLLALCPMLRPYAWPLEVSLTGSGFSASLRKRRKQLGSHRMPEGTARIYGPHHGEIFLQIGTGHTPTALQVDTALSHLDGFPEGLNVLGTPTRHPHDADFVTRYRYRQDSTVLTPAPGHAGHLLVLLVHADTEVLPGVPANPRIMLYPQRGLRHGDVLQQFPEPHFVFGEESEEEHVVSDPAGPPPPEPIHVVTEEPIPVLESGDEHLDTGDNIPQVTGPQHAASSSVPAHHIAGTGGTSLACLPSRSAPRRQIIFDPPGNGDSLTSRRSHNDDAVQLRPRHRPIGIPTPAGRRFLNADNPSLETPKSVMPATFEGDSAADSRTAHNHVTCPQVLHLDQLLPDEPLREGPGRLLLGVNSDMFSFIFSQFNLSLFSTDWGVLPELKPTTRQFLQGLPVLGPSSRPEAMQYYVDGSFFAGSDKCGWAIIAIGFHEGIWKWAGYVAVKADAAGSHHTLGAAVHSVFETELAAMAYAMAFCIGIPVPSMVGYDSTSAQAVATAGCFDQAGSALAQVCRSLQHLLHVMQRPPTWFHIRSHTGHPLNELADSAAKAGANGRFSTEMPTCLYEAQTGDVLPWLWTCLRLHPAVPAPLESGALPDAAAVADPSVNVLHMRPEQGAVKQGLRFRFRAVSYNCLTLQSVSQQESLCKQFHDRSVQVVGLQETRTSTTGRGCNEHFYTLHSPGQDGQLGCSCGLPKQRQ